MFTTRPELRGSFGMVSSTHWIASQTGMAVLERGGNAFDAAVAAGFVLQVVEPHLNGPGGEVPIILWDARRAAVEVIYDACRVPAMDGSGNRHAGLLTAADLSEWKARVEPPTQFTYAGGTVYKTAPWGQGPVFLQQLALLRSFDLKAMGFLSAEHVHSVTEAAKLAFADREAWYGDPDFADVPLGALLAEGYASQRRQLIGDRAS